MATLTGTLVSDLDPGGSLVAPPPGATLVSEGTPFTFNNTFITASAVLDVDAVPLPGALPLFATVSVRWVCWGGAGSGRRKQPPI